MAVIPGAHPAFIWTRERLFEAGESLKVREAGRRLSEGAEGRGRVTAAEARQAAAWYSRGLVKARLVGGTG